MPINIQGPQPVVIEDPGSSLWKGIGATVLRGVISDIFSDMRAERTKQISTLWECMKLNTEAALSMSDPEEVRDAINEMQIEYDNPSTPAGVKPGLGQLLGRLENHYDKMLENQPVLAAASMAKGHEKKMAEILQGSSDLNKDIPFLERASEGLQNDIDAVIAEAIPTADRKKRMASIEGVESSLTTLTEEIYPKFAEKYYQKDEQGNIIEGQLKQQVVDDLANPETALEAQKTVEQMQADSAYISAYVSEADKILQEDVYAVEEFNAPDYLRQKENPDFALAGALEDMMQNKEMIDTTIKTANIRKNFQNSVLELGQKIEASKTNREDFGALSAAFLGELNQQLSDNILFFDATHKAQLKKMEKDRKTVMGALSVLDAVEKINKGPVFDSPSAQIHLDNALQLATDGLVSENTTTVSDAFSSLNKAITEERAWDAGVITKMTQDKAKLEESTRGKLTPTVKSIASKLGTLEKREKNLDSSYLPGGEYELTMKPDQYFQGFTMERDANMKAYKDEVGIELAKLVKSSNLDGLDEKQKQAVNNLANIARKGNFEAADELYTILQGESKKLDFEGWGDEDSNAQSIYEQYLKLYGILYDADIDAQSSFGADYGYGQIRQAGNLQTATDESLMWMGK